MIGDNQEGCPPVVGPTGEPCTPENAPAQQPYATPAADGKPSAPHSPAERDKGVKRQREGATAYRAPDGRQWRYTGKRARVLAMLASGAGVTQWDTLPWHTRLGGTVHALRSDGLVIETQTEGEYRHARYWLRTPLSLIIQGENR